MFFAYSSIVEMPKESEEGFTLVEILVVILIIGILAAIAIPVFLNQRRVANDAKVESDVHNISLAVETFFVNNPTKTTLTTDEFRGLGSRSSEVVLHFGGHKDDFCIRGMHPNGHIYRSWENTPMDGVRPYVLYQSKAGGSGDKVTHISNLPCGSGPLVS